jgi:aminoglycoside 6'-N-acetyltransferase
LKSTLLQEGQLLPDEISFRPLHRKDFPLLQVWLSMPHVDAWWHERLDLAGLERKYGPRIDGNEPTHVFVIEHRERAIGWIQWYRWADYPEHGARLGAESDSAGIDLAIGAVELTGRGLGPVVIRAFLERVVFAERDITACVSDPETQNTRSLRAFEKAGFVRTGTVHLPGESGSRTIVRCIGTKRTSR